MNLVIIRSRGQERRAVQLSEEQTRFWNDPLPGWRRALKAMAETLASREGLEEVFVIDAAGQCVDGWRLRCGYPIL